MAGPLEDDDNNMQSTKIRRVVDEDGREWRQGHLMALLPLSRRNDDNERVLQEFRVYVELSAFLAYQHVQHRSGVVLPGLPERLEGCNFQWTYTHHDTQFSPLQAAREVLSYQLPEMKQSHNYTWVKPPKRNDNETALEVEEDDEIEADFPVADFLVQLPANETPSLLLNSTVSTLNSTRNETASAIPSGDSPRLLPPRRKRKRKLQLPPQSRQPQQPFAILGAARSVVSQAVGILGSAFDLPQISSSSTASTLDDLPFFGRTVPTNQGDAHATIVYLKRLGVSHLGVLHIEDSWGRKYTQDLQNYGIRYGIIIKSVSYINTPDGLEQAMVQLEQLDLRYFIGILNPNAWKPVVQKAYDFGLMGQPGNTWYIADLVELVGDGFALDRETEKDLALALHGTGVVFLQVTPHEEFDRALAAVADNLQLQQEFIASHSDPELLVNFSFSPNPGMSLFQYLTYDAIVALGITACDTPGLFTGKDFFNQLLQVDFQGVSGRVNLHEATGTRLGDSLQYQIVNMVLDDYLLDDPTTSTSSSMTFAADIASLIELSPQADNGTILPPAVHSVQPFVYFDNSTAPPIALPYFEEDLNLIPNSVLFFGLSLSILVMLISVAIAVWIYLNQTRYVIRASQPFFMMQLCAGTFILAATIIPMSWQEPRQGLDAACMTTPWLFSIGFSVAMSALFGKARRINQLIGVGTGFRRCTVEVKDVMKPFFILMSVNVVLLTAWSASPWRISWHRIPVDNNVDQFGRTQESYGVCRADGDWHFLFSVPLVTTNVIFLGMATWQSYRARALPSELSETSYLAVSMVSLTEVFCLGFTIVFTVMSQPTAFYLVSSVMITVGCIAILAPMFGPKFLKRNMREPRGRMASSIVMRRRPGDASRRVSGLHDMSVSDRSGGFRNPRSGNFRLGNGSGSMLSRSSASTDSRGSVRRSSLGLSTGTFHATTRRSNEDIGPFGSSQLRASTDHRSKNLPASTYTTLHTHEEESRRSVSDHSFG